MIDGLSQTLGAIVGDISTWLADVGGLIQYVLVFFFAAFPWVEILLVIPVAIGVGLNPVLVGIVAFAGNIGSVYVLLLFYRRIANWRRQRTPDSRDQRTDSRRARWARRLWDQYGLPGLALAAPILTGVHLAALFALAVGSRPHTVGWWMTIGIAVWTVLLTVSSAFGVSLLGL